MSIEPKNATAIVVPASATSTAPISVSAAPMGSVPTAIFPPSGKAVGWPGVGDWRYGRVPGDAERQRQEPAGIRAGPADEVVEATT